MQYTDNYDLMKPDLTDKYEVEHQNQNMNIIDGAMKGFDDIVSFESTNLITNGNFANGTTGWNASGANVASADNILSSTGNGTVSTFYVVKNTQLSGTKIMYYRAKARVTNDMSTALKLYYFGGGAVGGTIKNILNPVKDVWYDLSGVVSATYSVGNNMSIQNSYVDSATSNGKVAQIREVLAIDLTATFGAGNEPTQAQCDLMFAIWKDGKFQISSIASLENYKANKVQEAWITPKLANSWIPFDSATYNTFQYMKDEMGFVHIRGMVKSGTTGIIFTLPTGYRPLKTEVNPCLSNNVIGRVDINASGVVTCIVYNNTYVSLQGICFKAEQ